MSPVRVLWLTKGLGRGGAEMLLVALARAMDRTGIEIEVAYQLPHKTALVEPLEESGIPVHLLRGGRAWPLGLNRLLRTGRYDVVHSHAPLVGAVARLLVPSSTVMLHTEHNTWSRYHPATRLVNAATLGRNERVWAVSSQVAESIRPWRRGTTVEVMLHGVSADTVHRGGVARRTARRSLGVPGKTILYGTVGNLAPKKDQGTMIHAFSQVAATLPTAQLAIIGTGPRLAELQALVSRLGLDSRVRFLGMRDDVPELLPALDVFVMSSIHEGLSIAVIEALAAGVPVVSTRVGGIVQLITHEEQGLLVSPKDVEALRDAMVRLATDESLRRRLIAAGDRRAADFGIEPAAETLSAHYRQVVATRREEAAPA